jgi:hypothetical protein
MTLTEEVHRYIKRRAFCYGFSILRRFGPDGLKTADCLAKSGHVAILSHRAQMNLRNAGKLVRFRRTGTSVYVSQSS